MRTFLLSILMLCSGLTALAQNYNSDQKQLRSEIRDYLKKQDLNPEMQTDGLKFKYSNNNYYVEIDENEKWPMFVCIRRYVKYNQNITKEKIAQNINDCNTNYAVKVLCQEKSVILSAELFVKKSSEITDVFWRILSQLENSYDKINEL